MNTLPNCYRCGQQPCECKDGITLYCGDCLEVLPLLEPVGACVTDPPYGLEFMGKEWDKLGATKEVVTDKDNSFAQQRGGCLPFGGGGNRIRYGKSARSMQQWHQSWATAVMSALLPGAPLLAFGGTRTWHRLACAIEDAGFELRDTLMWIYGSGFPKSLDVSKAIDKAAGAEREVVKTPMTPHSTAGKGLSNELDERPWMTEARQKGYHEHAGDTPATDAAKLWDGWGTGLKPAWEPILLAMKPLDGTYAENAVRHGVAGLNVDGARVGTGAKKWQTPRGGIWSTDSDAESELVDNPQGRFPANVILSHHPECVQVRIPCEDCNGTGYASGVVEPLPEWATDEATLDDPKVSERRREWYNSLERCATCEGSGKRVGVKKVKGDKREGGDGRRPGGFVATGSDTGDSEPNANLYGDADGMETVEDWRCHEDCPVGMLPETKSGGGVKTISRGVLKMAGNERPSHGNNDYTSEHVPPDSGSAARFFYCAKASKADRGYLPAEELPLFGESIPEFVNDHPTVKPLELMKYLLTLVAMPTDMGLVDPFAGSGTTGVAAKQLGRRAILIESEEAYCEIAATRLAP